MLLPSLLLLSLLAWSVDATPQIISDGIPYWRPCADREMFNLYTKQCVPCGGNELFTRLQGVFGMCLNPVQGANLINYGVIIMIIKQLRGLDWWHDERPPVYCRDKSQCKVCLGGYIVSVQDACPDVQTININSLKCTQPTIYQYIPAANRCEYNPQCPKDRDGYCWAVGYNYMECAQFDTTGRCVRTVLRK